MGVNQEKLQSAGIFLENISQRLLFVLKRSIFYCPEHFWEGIF